MSSIKWAITIFGFLCLWTNANAKEVRDLQEKYTFENKEIVFGDQPIENNTFLYAACDIPSKGEKLSCTIILESFVMAEQVDRMNCTVSYTAVKGREVGQRKYNQFQLKLLFDNRVIFMWNDRPSLDNDLSLVWAETLIFKIIDMSSCNSVNRKIDYETSGYKFIGTSNFHIVPYVDTFDLYFYNKSLCGNMWCGQSYTKDGKLINGPVATYLAPSVDVCSAKPRSFSSGYFLLSNKFDFISPDSGKTKYLMNYPLDVETSTFSCANGQLGFCWLSKKTGHKVYCSQWNSYGNPVMDQVVYLEYNPGRWLAMHNLVGGGVLVLTSECNDSEWCVQNVDTVPFYALKVQRDGYVEEIQEIRGVDCNYLDIRTHIDEGDNGDVCVTFACKSNETQGLAFVHLMSKCISLSNKL